ncbi:hypothetical protein BAG01nite_48390 [Brevibacillus agri]|uniref:Uncharacterized protein n=1 Tax=Brevibacillus agri TaxID=51101 RepID=A0A3M8ALG8_9BACL|nr:MULTISPECIES: hypothetical protein [Brevibacillus]MED3501741.1 hypothetical protein [Brevibacillus agri]QAV15770.1 hypothetical protein BA6348_25250 [Brevibacillus agri]QHZ58463.1 hypothetical protein M655_024040 [Brevibacillus sp. NSP2.1]RNB51983.1 hypothetical protein EB820_19460 [Brevibacillus agri]GED28737.1 hypothetical protein BAG01nite_48390 [Brevibacillus agri]
MRQYWEDIIVLSGEGGRITLIGSKTSNGSWIFKKQTDETALADFFDDEDLSLLVHQQSSFVTGLDQVFTLLGRFWFRLRPLYIHPEFKKLIWETVAPKIEAHQLRYWEKVIQ